MPDVLAISEMALINDMKLMNLMSHNIANANTNGYRRDLAVSSTFQASMDAAENANQQSMGVMNNNVTVPAVSLVRDNSTGVLKHTANSLDLGIEGSAYFELSDGNRVMYSRRGMFQLDAMGRMVDSNGLVVNGVNGEIRISSGSPRIDSQGNVWSGDEHLGQIKLVDFDRPELLEKTDSNYFLVAAAGVSNKLVDSTVRQGFVEASNVNVSKEMVDMMSTVRHVEITQRLVNSYDSMLGNAIQNLGEF